LRVELDDQRIGAGMHVVRNGRIDGESLDGPVARHRLIEHAAPELDCIGIAVGKLEPVLRGADRIFEQLHADGERDVERAAADVFHIHLDLNRRTGNGRVAGGREADFLKLDVDVEERSRLKGFHHCAGETPMPTRRKHTGHRKTSWAF
jgi:hypothetical protein